MRVLETDLESRISILKDEIKNEKSELKSIRNQIANAEIHMMGEDITVVIKSPGPLVVKGDMNCRVFRGDTVHILDFDTKTSYIKVKSKKCNGSIWLMKKLAFKNSPIVDRFCEMVKAGGIKKEKEKEREKERKKESVELAIDHPVYLQPSRYSRVLRTFGQKAKVIGSVNGYFEIESMGGRIGYTYIFDGPSTSRMENTWLDKPTLTDLIIKSAYLREINSANGVDFGIDWAFVSSDKIIKYITFTVTPYNQVGDPQSCSISGHSQFKGRITGPIYSEKRRRTATWETAWYNQTISCIKINKVAIEFMDGTKRSFTDKMLPIDPRLNMCK